LFYEFASIYFFNFFLKKKLGRKNIGKIFYYNNSKLNEGKVFEVRKNLINFANEKKVEISFFNQHVNSINIGNLFNTIFKYLVNYKKIFTILKQNALLNSKILNTRYNKNCLSFFKNYRYDTWFLKNKIKVLRISEISKNNELSNEKVNKIKKIIFEFLDKKYSKKKIKNEKKYYDKEILVYLLENLEKYLIPLLSVKNFKDRGEKLDFAIWNRPVVNFPGYNLIVEYLLNLKTPVVGRQHGAAYVDCYSPDQHFDMDFNRCTHWLSFASNKDIFKKTYGKKKPFCKIIPSGNDRFADSKPRREVDILFPITPLNHFLVSRPIEKEIFTNQKSILETLNKKKNLNIVVKPVINLKQNSFLYHQNIDKYKNLKSNYYYSLKKYLKIYKPNLVILEFYSTPLYDVIDDNCDIFLLNETIEKISSYAKKNLKKRVFLFDKVENLNKAIKNYDVHKIKKLRNNSFYKNYVDRGNLEDSLKKITSNFNFF